MWEIWSCHEIVLDQKCKDTLLGNVRNSYARSLLGLLGKRPSFVPSLIQVSRENLLMFLPHPLKSHCTWKLQTMVSLSLHGLSPCFLMPSPWGIQIAIKNQICHRLLYKGVPFCNKIVQNLDGFSVSEVKRNHSEYMALLDSLSFWDLLFSDHIGK